MPETVDGVYEGTGFLLGLPGATVVAVGWPGLGEGVAAYRSNPFGLGGETEMAPSVLIGTPPLKSDVAEYLPVAEGLLEGGPES